MTTAARALADVARLGCYAAVGPGSAGIPVEQVYGAGPVLDERIAHVARALDCSDRVAASIAFQGLAALLVTPPFAAAAVHGVLPVLTPRTLHWMTSTSPWEQTCADPTGVAVPSPADAVTALAGALLEPHLRPLVAAVRARVSVSPRVLWGSAASTVAAAKRLVGTTWPDRAGHAAAVAEGLLASGELAGLGECLPPRPPDLVWTYRRRTCCLYYLAATGAYCGDCVLAGR